MISVHPSIYLSIYPAHPSILIINCVGVISKNFLPEIPYKSPKRVGVVIVEFIIH